MRVLISCAGRRNDLVSYFAANEAFSQVHCCDMDIYAPSWEYANNCHITTFFDSPDYLDNLLDICSDNKIDLILSLNDFELPLLAKNKREFEEIGTRVLVSSPKVIEICWDKLKTNEFLRANNFSAPKEYSLEEINNDSIFPLIVKPRFGTASIGVEIAQKHVEFETVYNYSKLKVSKSAIAKNEIEGGDLLIQEKVSGVEYAVDIINDMKGRYCGSVIKRKIGIRNGDASLVITENNERISNYTKELAQKLGHIGNLDVDLIVSNDHIYCVDLNPRFGGAYPFSHLSGVDLPEIISNWLKDDESETPIKYEDNIVTVRTEAYMRLEKFKNFVSDK